MHCLTLRCLPLCCLRHIYQPHQVQNSNAVVLLHITLHHCFLRSSLIAQRNCALLEVTVLWLVSFLNRIASHPLLQCSEDLQTFLEANEETLNAAKRQTIEPKQPAAQQQGGLGRWFKVKVAQLLMGQRAASMCDAVT